MPAVSPPVDLKPYCYASRGETCGSMKSKSNGKVRFRKYGTPAFTQHISTVTNMCTCCLECLKLPCALPSATPFQPFASHMKVLRCGQRYPPEKTKMSRWSCSKGSSLPC